MCWNAHTSFTTLGIGTLLNVLSFTILHQRDSPVRAMVWAWQYALLMQIPEGIAWVQLDRGESDIAVASRVAMFLNLTQPLALFVATRSSLWNGELKYGHVALFMYFLLLVSEANELWDGSVSIAPEEGCAHLDLAYWNTSRGISYVFASVFVLSEVRLVYWALVNASIFLVSLLLSLTLYTCGVGSVWCWLIFMTGPILVAADLLQNTCVSLVTPRRTLSTTLTHPSSSLAPQFHLERL